jgi:hypothetical protein
MDLSQSGPQAPTAPGAQPSPKDTEVLEFDVVEEKWNKYDLADQTVLKARVIIARIARPKFGPTGQYSISGQTIFSVTAPPEKRGQSMQLPPQSEWNTLPKDPVKILTNSEPWNKYRIPKTGDVLQVKLVVTEVFRVRDHCDSFGEPFYIVTSGPLVSPATKGSVSIGLEGAE